MYDRQDVRRVTSAILTVLVATGISLYGGIAIAEDPAAVATSLELSTVLPLPGKFGAFVKSGDTIIGISIQPGEDQTEKVLQKPSESIPARKAADIRASVRQDSSFILNFYSGESIPVQLNVGGGLHVSMYTDFVGALRAGRNIFLEKGEFGVPIVDASNGEPLGRVLYIIEDAGVITWDTEKESPTWYNFSVRVELEESVESPLGSEQPIESSGNR